MLVSVSYLPREITKNARRHNRGVFFSCFEACQKSSSEMCWAWLAFKRLTMVFRVRITFLCGRCDSWLEFLQSSSLEAKKRYSFLVHLGEFFFAGREKKVCTLRSETSMITR